MSLVLEMKYLEDRSTKARTVEEICPSRQSSAV